MGGRDLGIRDLIFGERLGRQSERRNRRAGRPSGAPPRPSGISVSAASCAGSTPRSWLTGASAKPSTTKAGRSKAAAIANRFATMQPESHQAWRYMRA